MVGVILFMVIVSATKDSTGTTVTSPVPASCSEETVVTRASALEKIAMDATARLASAYAEPASTVRSANAVVRSDSTDRAVPRSASVLKDFAAMRSQVIARSDVLLDIPENPARKSVHRAPTVTTANCDATVRSRASRRHVITSPAPVRAFLDSPE